MIDTFEYAVRFDINDMPFIVKIVSGVEILLTAGDTK